ncbi:GNAT family N-acetyltransferase [Pendulispora albinea]|uniref:GNAT family N-acetyltransferase n=1 Tax=Pendulispora albinea TaxID=2741071 RepID=A0ABZ2MBW7_9BACT
MPTSRPIAFRPATAADAEVLTLIVHESHGYRTPEERALVQSIVLTPEYLTENASRILEYQGETAGFYTLLAVDSEMELDMFFVDERFARLGLGRALFEDMCRLAKHLGAREVVIVSNPDAAAFYERMGARPDGAAPPTSRIPWSRPRYRVDMG